MGNADSKTPNSPKRNKNENVQLESQQLQGKEEKGYCCVSYAQSTDLAMKLITESSGYHKRIHATLVSVAFISTEQEGTEDARREQEAFLNDGKGDDTVQSRDKVQQFIDRFHADQRAAIEDLDEEMDKLEFREHLTKKSFIFYRYLEFLTYKAAKSPDGFDDPTMKELLSTLYRVLRHCSGLGDGGGICIFLETTTSSSTDDSSAVALQPVLDKIKDAAEIRFLDDMLGESGDNVASLLEKAFDLVPGSFPLAMPHATEQNTSPLTALVRAYALSNIASASTSDYAALTLDTDGAVGDRRSLQRSLLWPIDEWFFDQDEGERSPMLKRASLITNTGRTVHRTGFEITNDNDVLDPNMMLGRVGREATLGSAEASQTEMSMASVSRHRLTGQGEGASGEGATGAAELEARLKATQLDNQPPKTFVCLVHERVARELDKRRNEIADFVNSFVKKEILEKQVNQHHKLVEGADGDVMVAKLFKKGRIFYARIDNIILILDVLWDFNYQSKQLIARTQTDIDELKMRANHEMNILSNWMNLAQDKPYVVVDFMSGMLRPLFNLPLDTKESFKYNMMNMVLSPSQVDAVELACKHAKDTGPLAAAGKKSAGLTAVAKPSINVVVLQGSAGNGKTTCLLRSGLKRAKENENVVFVAATKLLADSVKNDLYGSIESTFRINVKKDFKDLVAKKVKSIQGILASEMESGTEYGSATASSVSEEQKSEAALMTTLVAAASHEDLTNEEVMSWLNGLEARLKKSGSGGAMDVGEKDALRDWLMSGHREAADTITYKDKYVKDYEEWKAQNRKKDEGDMWALAKDLLSKVEEADRAEEITGEKIENTLLVRTVKQVLGEVERECDVLLIDEAQLYPSETVFKVLLLWYKPRKTLLLGMDTKQAVTLGCSKRDDLVAEVREHWDITRDDVKSLQTNFRLPARLVALSNAMVRILRRFYPKVFDEYKMDEGFESRSATTASSSSASAAAAVPAAVEGQGPLAIGDAGEKKTPEGLTIEKFPVMLVLGDAAKQMRKEIIHRLTTNRRSVHALRFADLKSQEESAMGRDEEQDSTTELSSLPTINFQAVSGLEVLQTVIVDRLLATYITDVCPRTIFATAVNPKKGMSALEGQHASMMRKALCLVYTVVTRCRGPLIWLEDDQSPVIDKAHPLVGMLKGEFEGSKMDIEIVTDAKLINKAFVDRIFDHAGADLDQINQAFEESAKALLDKFKKSFWLCSTMLSRQGIRGGVHAAQFMEASEEYKSLQRDKKALINQLAASSLEGVAECSAFIDKLPATLLVRIAAGGPGDTFQWASEWSDELRDLIASVELFPRVAQKVLKESTQFMADFVAASADQEAAAARSSQPPQAALSTIRPPRTLTGLDRVKEKLCRNLRICSCGEGPKPADLTLCFAFPSPGGTTTGIGSSNATVTSASTSTSPVWLLHKIHRDSTRLCALSDTYMLSCYRTLGPHGGSTSATSSASTASHDPNDTHTRVLDDNGLVLLKFAESAELSITRASSGYLLLQERSFVSGQGPHGLLRSTSSCQGMKLRCGARGVSLGGFALRHSYGPFVTEVEGNLLGAEMKFRRNVGPISSVQGVLRLPPVGDERMISIIERLLNGQRLHVNKLTDTKGDPSGGVAGAYTSLSASDDDQESLWKPGPPPVRTNGTATTGTGGTKFQTPSTQPDRRGMARFVWNNFFGGRLLFASAGAKFQPWHVLANMLDSAAVIGSPSMTMNDILEDIHREVDLYMRHHRLVLANGISSTSSSSTNGQGQGSNDQDKKGNMENKAAGSATSVQQQQQPVFVPTSDIVRLK